MTRPSWLNTVTKLATLAAIVVLSTWASRTVPTESLATPVAALGLLLLAGDLLAEIVERFKLPHLTGYLFAGLMLGPHGLGTVSHHAIESLSLVNALALALIALSAGGELTLGLLGRSARSLFAATGTQLLICLPIATLGFFLMRPFFPFLEGYDASGVFAVALMWGVLAISRSPAATLGLIAQVRPDGPLTRYALSVVIAFDIVVLLVFSLVVELGRSLLSPDLPFGLAALETTGMEIIGSIAAGTTLGLIVTAFLKMVGRQLILFLLVIAYGMTEFCAYFNYDALLLFVVAGFVTANVSQRGGERLLEAVSQGGRVVYVVFFALAGAHLDLPLLAELWPVALGLAGLRVAGTWLAVRAGSRIARDPEPIRRFGWMPLVSQAGVTIGMAVIIAEVFASSIGPSLRALTIAVVGINEAVGPILFKIALDRAGETGKLAAPPEGEEALAAQPHA